jgi:hypothetical protein
MSGTLEILFEGWFMCRLATDPDPTDEPRGVSGATFALPGEPDFDRVIYLQEPPAGTVRSYAPPVGVYVKAAHVEGKEIERLHGAKVRLLGQPRLENRNFVLTVAGYEPIVPFHLEISGNGISLTRELVMYPEDPELEFWKIPRERLQSYGARGFYTDTDKVLASTGVRDPLENRRERRRLLLEDLEREPDELRRAGLRKRVRELDIAIREPTNERLVNMRAIEEFRFGLNGPSKVVDPQGLLGAVTQPADWPIDFWMGGWDPDVLCGYMKGSLQIPIQ